jgi:hypothetical protein
MSQTVSSGRRELAHFVRCHGHGFSGFNPGIDPWVVFVELMYLVGGLVLRAVSFGVMRAAPSDVPYRDFNWFWARRNGNGQIEVEPTAAGGIGFIIVFICLAAFLRFF